MRLVIYMQPVHAAAARFVCGQRHQVAADALALVTVVDGGVEKEGVDAAVPRHVDKPTSGSP